MQRNEDDDPPPDSIAVFEELIHNMGSQESRDTGDLRIGEQKRVAN